MSISNQIKTAVFLALLTGLLLFVGYLIGGRTGLAIALAISLLMNFVSFWFSDKIVLAMYHAKEADPRAHRRLHELVADLARQARIPKPKVYIVENASPNAFATGRSPERAAVACTTGILGLLSEDELRGVLAHELAHVKNRDTLIATIAATIAGVISYIAHMAQWALIFGRGGDRDRGAGGLLGGLVLIILTPLIALILQLAISRSREYFADETGARTIRNPLALASALQKLETGVAARPMHADAPATASLFIVNPFSASPLLSLFSPHPPLKERIRRLRDMRV